MNNIGPLYMFMIFSIGLLGKDIKHMHIDIPVTYFANLEHVFF